MYRILKFVADSFGLDPNLLTDGSILNSCPWGTKEFCSEGSTNSVEDRGQRERGSGGGSPLVGGSAQFTNE
jgi:hypothetical protein